MTQLEHQLLEQLNLNPEVECWCCKIGLMIELELDLELERQSLNHQLMIAVVEALGVPFDELRL